MLPAARGLPSIDDVSAKYAAQRAFRLRAEYLPGPAPFPDSPEEQSWLAQRETLVLTVLAAAGHGLIKWSWRVGGDEKAGERELAGADLTAWSAEMEAAGGWEIAALATLAAGEGTAQFEHEAYEYQDSDPDSLDLDAWRPPRHCRVQNGDGPAEPTLSLLRVYARFLPGETQGSPLTHAIRG